MHLATHVDALQRDLSAAVAGADDRTTQTAARLAAALEPSLRLRLLEVLGEAARELADQIPGGRVDVRLVGTDPLLVFADESSAPASGDAGEYTARISLRLPENLKAKVDAAAARENLSVNSWIVSALSRAAEDRQRRVGTRLTGFARS